MCIFKISKYMSIKPYTCLSFCISGFHLNVCLNISCDETLTLRTHMCDEKMHVQQQTSFCWTCVKAKKKEEKSNYRTTIAAPFSHTRSQFHQHFARSFFVWKFCKQLFLYLHFRFKFFYRKNMGVKAALKMLVKLTPGVYHTKQYFLHFTIFAVKLNCFVA